MMNALFVIPFVLGFVVDGDGDLETASATTSLLSLITSIMIVRIHRFVFLFIFALSAVFFIGSSESERWLSIAAFTRYDSVQ